MTVEVAVGRARSWAVARGWLGALLGVVVTLVVASLFVFILIRLSPVDPARSILQEMYGDAAPSEADIERIRELAHLDEPLLVQYFHWLGGVLRLDFGQSLVRSAPVASLIAERLPPTVVLTLVAIVLAAVSAVVVGLATVRRPVARAVVSAITQFSISIPNFVAALTLVLCFAVYLRWVPASGWGSPIAVILPILVLMMRPWATFCRLVMASGEEAARSDWMRTGKAKGLSWPTLLMRHVRPHALLATVGMFGVVASGALSSTIIVEVVFAIPGLGQLLYQSVVQRDIPVIQAVLMLQVLIAILSNTIANRALTRLDPKLRS